MNSLHWSLILLACIFVVLYGLFPRNRAIAFTYLRYVVLGIAAWIMLAPFAWLICSVIKDKDVLMTYTFLPPIREWSRETLNLDNFRALFAGEQSLRGTVYFWQYIVNSLFLACTMTMVQLFFSSLGGYALAKYDFKGRTWLMFYMLGTRMVPGLLLLAPVYKMMFNFGWMDTYWALIVPGAANVFGMFLFRQAMLNTPDSLIEAARIDGCGEFSIYYTVVMPLVRPMTGAFCLVTFMGSWNSFLGPQIYLQSKAKLTLPVILNQYVGVYQQQYGVFLAGTLLAIIPPAILFFALQREFVAGLSSGAVKG